MDGEMKLFATVPDNEDIQSMVVHKDILIVATANKVYILSADGVFTPIMFEGDTDER